MLELSENDEEDLALLENYDPTVFAEYYHNMDSKGIEKKAYEMAAIEEKLLKKYGYYPFGSIFEGADINPLSAIFFNPYYSVPELLRFEYYGCDREIADLLCEYFTLSEITDFKMPVYVLQGNMDCHCGAV